MTVLVDAPGRGRSVREAPEIDGVVRIEPPTTVIDEPAGNGSNRGPTVGSFVTVIVTGAEGPDLTAVADPVGAVVGV